MKITFDINCSPQEARAFLGLPDMTPLHDLYLDRMKSFVTDGVAHADFEQIMRSWMPGMGDQFETWRKAIFNAARPKSD